MLVSLVGLVERRRHRRVVKTTVALETTQKQRGPVRDGKEILQVQNTGAFQIRIVCYDGPPSAGSTPLINVTVPFETWQGKVVPLMMTRSEYEIACTLPTGIPKPPAHTW